MKINRYAINRGINRVLEFIGTIPPEEQEISHSQYYVWKNHEQRVWSSCVREGKAELPSEFKTALDLYAFLQITTARGEDIIWGKPPKHLFNKYLNNPDYNRSIDIVLSDE